MRSIWVHHTDAAYRTLTDYVSERIWGKREPMPNGTAMAVLCHGKPRGVALFHNHDARNGVIEISAAADGPWLNRAILHEMFSYVFHEIGCQAAVMRCDAGDRKMDRIARAYGFTRHDIPHLRGKGKAEAVFVLGVDDWQSNKFEAR